MFDRVMIENISWPREVAPPIFFSALPSKSNQLVRSGTLLSYISQNGTSTEKRNQTPLIQLPVLGVHQKCWKVMAKLQRELVFWLMTELSLSRRRWGQDITRLISDSILPHFYHIWPHWYMSRLRLHIPHDKSRYSRSVDCWSATCAPLLLSSGLLTLSSAGNNHYFALAKSNFCSELLGVETKS